MINNIYEIRGRRVMLDEDLAKLYGVETKVLNQAVKRNSERFPEEFMFKLTDVDLESLRSQIVTSNDSEQAIKPFSKHNSLKSQIVTSNRGGRRKKPFVFTEHGTVMLASVLRSEQAVKMSIEVVKAFVHLRQALVSHGDMAKQLSEVRSFMLKRANKTDREFNKVWRAIEKLTMPSNDEQSKQIGFRAD